MITSRQVSPGPSERSALEKMGSRGTKILWWWKSMRKWWEYLVGNDGKIQMCSDFWLIIKSPPKVQYTIPEVHTFSDTPKTKRQKDGVVLLQVTVTSSNSNSWQAGRVWFPHSSHLKKESKWKSNSKIIWSILLFFLSWAMISQWTAPSSGPQYDKYETMLFFSRFWVLTTFSSVGSRGPTLWYGRCSNGQRERRRRHSQPSHPSQAGNDGFWMVLVGRWVETCRKCWHFFLQ